MKIISNKYGYALYFNNGCFKWKNFKDEILEIPMKGVPGHSYTTAYQTETQAIKALEAYLTPEEKHEADFNVVWNDFMKGTHG